jgi:hypothetical protein
MSFVPGSRPRGLARPALPALLAAGLALACGANEAEPSAGSPRAAASETPTAPGPDEGADAPAEDAPAEDAPAEDEAAGAGAEAATANDGTDAPGPPDGPEAEPEPVVVEAGTRLGPVRIGMSEADVRALGLPEAEVDPRSRRFGPYRVFFDDDGAVRRVEAQMGALERVRIGEETFPVGTHIHQLRDAIGDCRWYEGGGERYRCAGGTLFVQTTHSLDPARYTIAVARR